MRPDADTTSDNADETPPVAGSWRRLYAIVLVELAVLTIAFYALTRWAA